MQSIVHVKTFLKADCSKRIKKALNSKVRTYAEVNCEPGEEVYYKRRKAKGWCGPAKVVAKEGNFVTIRQGGRFYRCHPCHLMKVQPKGCADPTEINSARSNKSEIINLQAKKRGEYVVLIRRRG